MKISIPAVFLLIFSIGISHSQDHPSWDNHGAKITDGCSVPQFAVTTSSEIQRVTKKVRDCCVTHDKAYFEGKKPEFSERKKADQALKKCMQNKNELGWAHGFYLGVRTGGCSIKKQSYRWGFGKDWVLLKGKPTYKPVFSKKEEQKALLIPCLRR